MLGYFGISIIHRTLTWTTGFLTSLFDAYTLGTSVYSLIIIIIVIIISILCKILSVETILRASERLCCGGEFLQGCVVVVVVWLVVVFSVCFLIIFFYHYLFYYFIVPCWKLGSPYPSKAQQPQEQRYPSLSVCAVFPCVQTRIWLPVFGIFNVCSDADECDFTRGLYGESALRADSWRKIPCRTRDSNPRQYWAWWLFSRTLYPLSCSRLLRG